MSYILVLYVVKAAWELARAGSSCSVRAGVSLFNNRQETVPESSARLEGKPRAGVCSGSLLCFRNARLFVKKPNISSRQLRGLSVREDNRRKMVSIVPPTETRLQASWTPARRFVSLRVLRLRLQSEATRRRFCRNERKYERQWLDSCN